MGESIKTHIPEDARRVIEELSILTERITGRKSVTVITTEEMSPEEKKLSLIEGFLKEGYPLPVAIRKAEEWLKVADILFK